METRVAALEADMKDAKAGLLDIRVILARIDERTTHMATTAGVADLRTGLAHMATRADVADLRTELASKAGRGTVWTAGATMVGLVIAAVALGAVYMPYLATLLRRAAP